jgi:hypothetical protein
MGYPRREDAKQVSRSSTSLSLKLWRKRRQAAALQNGLGVEIGCRYSTSVFFSTSGGFRRSLTLDFLPAFTSMFWVLDTRPLDSKTTV